MIQIKFKDCCKECRHRKSYMKEDQISNGDSVIKVITVIGCEHEEVCRKYVDPVKRLEISRDELYSVSIDNQHVWIQSKLREAGFDLDKDVKCNVSENEDKIIYTQEEEK